MDDTRLELNVILPPNHPLGTVTVEPGMHAGGTANWRNCHMQLSIFLTHQVLFTFIHYSNSYYLFYFILFLRTNGIYPFTLFYIFGLIAFTKYNN